MLFTHFATHETPYPLANTLASIAAMQPTRAFQLRYSLTLAARALCCRAPQYAMRAPAPLKSAGAWFLLKKLLPAFRRFLSSLSMALHIGAFFSACQPGFVVVSHYTLLPPAGSHVWGLALMPHFAAACPRRSPSANARRLLFGADLSRLHAGTMHWGYFASGTFSMSPSSFLSSACRQILSRYRERATIARAVASARHETSARAQLLRPRHSTFHFALRR